MRTPEGSPLELPITGVPGVGPERGVLLARLHLHTIGDLLLHRPRRYEDRRHLCSIRELEMGTSATTRGHIVAQGVKTFRRRSQSLFEFVLEDGTGRLHCRWWNLPYMERYFAVGDEVLVFGRVRSLKPRAIDHPETEVIERGDEPLVHLDRIVPIYPLTEGLSQRWLRGLIWRVLARYADAVPELWPGLALTDLPGRREAVRQLHFPETEDASDKARARLALDEFIGLQLEIRRRRRHLETHAAALPCAGDNRLTKPFLRALAFRLTDAQTRVLREIRRDMGGPHPMRRLLQGDVGSGKTAVAACTALMAMESGFNVALMAPTEILAEQHFQTFENWFGPLGIRVALRTGDRRTDPGLAGAAGSALSLEFPGEHGPVLFLGTHALIEADVELPRLGLVIIDEQHKFGVAQRETLLRKGRYPHLLVMTATPIPRTLGLTIYGDLDVSVIDELPAGRGRVRTFVRSAAQLGKVHGFVRDKVKEGRQAYLVFPRVDEAEAPGGLKAVTREWERLSGVFAPLRVGLLHGRLRRGEKEKVMTAFRRGEIHIMVATSVIEVGVDVPNATVMVIENADRFGLAQLHQLRGRIGRGAHESFCILVAEARTVEARERLKVLEHSNDGFAIAEADLRLRGPGDFLGQDQSGLPPLWFGDLLRDLGLIERARQAAAELLQ